MNRVYFNVNDPHLTSNIGNKLHMDFRITLSSVKLCPLTLVLFFLLFSMENSIHQVLLQVRTCHLIFTPHVRATC